MHSSGHDMPGHPAPSRMRKSLARRRALRPTTEGLERRIMLAGGDNRPEFLPIRVVSPARHPGQAAVAARASATAVRHPTPRSKARGLGVAANAYPVPGKAGDVIRLSVTLSARQARFRNEVGLFVVDDATGRIGRLRPGDRGYARAALAAGRRLTLFRPDQEAGSLASIELPAGSHVGFYLVQDSTAERFLAPRARAAGVTRPRAHFSFPAANGDRLRHVLRRAGDVIAFEDLHGGGDRDYNDAVLTIRTTVVTPGPAPGPLPTDTAPPLVTLADPAAGTLTNGPLALAGSAIDAGGGIRTVEARIDGGAPFAVAFDAAGAFRTPLDLAGQKVADGPHTIQVRATDRAGNLSDWASRDFIYDATPPALAAGPSSPASPANRAVTIPGTARDDGSGVLEVLARLDDAPAASVPFDASTGAFTFAPGLALDGSGDGPHTAQFRARDRAGNLSDWTPVSFVLDTLAPTVTIAEPSAALQTRANVAIKGRAADAGTGVSGLTARVDGGAEQTVDLDGSGQFTFTTPFALDGTSDGSHTVVFRAVDRAGNASAPSEVRLILDATAPAVVIAAPDPGSLGRANVTVIGTVRDGLTGVEILEARLDGQAFGPATFDASGGFSFATTLALDGTADGGHTVALRATDRVGNVSSPSTLSFTLDTTPPVLELGPADPTSPSSRNVTVAGTARDAVAGVAAVEARLDGGAAVPLTMDAATGGFSYTSTLALDGTADGSHAVEFRARDLAGNQGDWTPLTFVLDTVAPAATLLLDPASDLDVAGDDMTYLGRVRLIGQTEPGLLVTLPATGASTRAGADGRFAFDDVPLAVGSNPLQVEATDAAGNVGRAARAVERCGFDDQLGGWTALERGGTDASRGAVTVQDGAAALREGDSFTVGIERSFAVTAALKSIRIIYDDPAFDATAQGSIRDAFEAALVDESGAPLVHAFASGRDAFYNVGEGAAAALGQEAAFEGRTLVLDTSSLFAGTDARLILRLVNNDSDTGSSVRILCVDLSEVSATAAAPAGSTAAPPTGPSAITAGPAPGATAAILASASPPAASLASPGIVIDAPAPDQVLAVGGTMVIAGHVEGAGLPPTSVSIDGIPADAIDASGRFFARTTVAPGRTEFRIEAVDATGQTLQTSLTVQGVDAPPAIDFTRLSDVSASLSGVYGRTSFHDDSSVLYADLAIRNGGTYAANRSLLLGITHISDPSVRVRGQAGTTPDGIPYYDFTPSLTGGRLEPGATGASQVVAFANPGRVRFTYELVVLGVLDRAPAFTTVPDVEAPAGRPYAYDADATDPDGDPLSYALLGGPATMAIDPASGALSWAPTSTEIGTTDVVIEASDGRGGTAIQRYTLSVVAPPPNRPPVFTSVPIVDATVSRIDSTLQLLNFDELTGINYSPGTAVGPSSRLSDEYLHTMGVRFASDGGPAYVAVANLDSFGTGHAPSTPNGIGGVTSDGRLDYGVPILVTFSLPDRPEVPGFTDFVSMRSDTVGDGQTLAIEAFDLAGRRIGYQSAIDIGGVTLSLGVPGIHSIRILSSNTAALDEFRFHRVTAQGIQGYEYAAAAVDPDSDSVAYRLTESPAGMSIDSQTGIIRWAPAADRLGANRVIVEASDGRGGTATQAFTILVAPEPGNHGPVIVSQPVLRIEGVTGPSLIGNGGFEAPAGPPTGYATYFAGDPSLAPWEITDGSVEPIGDLYWPAYEGGQSLDLHGGGPGAIRQAFDTIPGRTYSLDFAYGNNPGYAEATAKVEVVGANTLLDRTISHAGSTFTDIHYDLFHGTFVADSSRTTLRFTGLTGAAWGIVLDAVEVTAAVPYSYDVDAIDADDDTLTYALTQAPAGMEIDPQSGLIQWHPSTSVALSNTGISPSGGPLSQGDVDPHWTIVSGPGITSPVPAIVTNQGFYATSSASRWVWVNASGGGGSNATYTFRQTIDLTGFDPGTAVLTGAWGADNDAIILLNGAPPEGTGTFTLGGYTTANFNRFHAFSITGGFVPGLNTLDIVVTDYDNLGACGVTDLSLAAGRGEAEIPVTVRVEDGRGGFDEQSFTIDVGQTGGRIEGTKFNDLNGNGVRDQVDESIPNPNPDQHSILLLTGSGSPGSVGPQLEAAGFTVIVRRFGPGEIAAVLPENTDIDQVWVWNDGSYGNTGVPADPARSFTTADLEALAGFASVHTQWIMDDLAWRGSEEAAANLTKNEAVNLFRHGGGIVLGTDDASGEAIVQHVNQVAAYFNFNPFTGVYYTTSGLLHQGGSIFDSPSVVNPFELGSTATYAEVPHGMQPNGVFLATAIFGSPTTPIYGSPPLGGDVFAGVTYPMVNHIITASFPGAGIDSELEPGLPNWTVYLDQNQNGRLDPGERSTTTDADGNYAFTGLPAGNYYVREEPQPGWVQTFPGDQGGASTTAYYVDWTSADVAQGVASGVITLPGGSTVSVDFQAVYADGSPGTLYGAQTDGGTNYWTPSGPYISDQITDAPPDTDLLQLSGGQDQIYRVTLSEPIVDPVMAIVSLGAPTAPTTYDFDAPFTIVSQGTGFFGGTSTSLAQLPGDILLGAEGHGVVRFLGTFSTFSWVVPTPEAWHGFTFAIRSSESLARDGFHLVNLAGGGVATGKDFGNRIDPDPPENSRPEFDSFAPTSATVGQVLRYDASAADPDHDPLAFDLVVRPEGMAVDPTTGVVVWRPAADQTGTFDVILRVRDGRGGVDLQPFRVTASWPNTAPAIASSPPGPTATDVAYEYRVRAQDADGDSLAYRLDAAPDGMAIDPATGLLSWPAAQAGSHHVEVVADDGRGGVARQAFDLQVSDGLPNTQPTIRSGPGVGGRLGSVYRHQVEVDDPDGDPLTYTLDAAPSGMTIGEGGLIAWTPGPDQLGDRDVTVRVEDGRGGVAMQSFTIVVSTTVGNAPPTIVSTPTTEIVAGRAYRYDATAEDPEGDPLVWSLEQAPAGMSIDPATGTVRWTPVAGQLGSQDVVLSVLDARGGRATQSFAVDVRAVNTPPSIVSTPPTQGYAGGPYSYAVRATDVDGDVLSFAILGPPTMTIDPATGLIRWDPTAADVAIHEITVLVGDGTATSSQVFDLDVSNTSFNVAPTITSSPGSVAGVGDPYTYAVTATDPDGDALIFSLPAAPDRMTITPSGVITWSPDASQLGPQAVTVAVRDPAGNVATQAYTLTVRVANQQPTIDSTAPTEVAAGRVYRYDVRAGDPDGDLLGIRLATAPAGMTLDAGNGRITWTTTMADLGRAAVEVVVSDGRGGEARQVFEIVVGADTTAPRVTLTAAPDPINVGETTVLVVAAVDDVGVTGLTLTFDGVAVPVDDSGRARVPTSRVGAVPAVATATDAAGNVGTATISVTVVDPSDAEAPVVAIASPADDAVITGPVPVTGTVSDANLVDYTLELEPVAGGAAVVIARGTSGVTDGVLGTLDPSRFANDTYILRLVAHDAGGHTSTDERLVSFAGELKLGNFTLSFTDLAVPVSGIPITVGRTYDSLNAATQGDFGFGWRLEFGNTDLRTGVAKTGAEADGLFNAFRDRTRVYVTLPGGRREGFTFQPQPAPGLRGSFLGIYRAQFVPDAGVTDSLTVESFDLRRFSDGSYGDYGGALPYNPADPAFGGTFTLTTKEGVVYTIDGLSGRLRTVADRNGNGLEFSDAGILSKSGQRVTFERDPQGRIGAVVDPSGGRIAYRYDARGDLVSVTDRAGGETRLAYRTDRPHYLERVIDPLGRTGIRSEYDDQGRHFRLIDAAGDPVRLEYDPAQSTQTVVDQLGNAMVYTYDDRGNVVATVDALGGVTRYTYDANNDELTVEDPLHRITTRTYDARGNVLTETDPLGHVTRTTYDRHGNVLTQTDALGNTTTNAYDDRGNLTEMRDPSGKVTKFTYDASGNPLAMADAVGTLYRFEYDAAGHVTRRTDALGNATVNTYDPSGRLLSETRTQTTPAGVRTLVTRTEYDAEGRVIKVTDAEGGVTETRYDAAGQKVASIDALGRTTAYAYDDRGRLVETIFPDATPDDLADNPRTRAEYDAAGRQVATIDEAGRRTEMQYDALGRPVATVYPDATPGDPDDNPRTRTEYDAAGQQVATIDELGRRTEFEYDAAGRQTVVRDALGGEATTTYDDAGRSIGTTDALGHRTEFVHDAAGRAVRTIFADGTSVSSEFDARGRVIARTDQLDRTTRYEYDAADRLVAVVDALDQRTAYGYDEAGDLVSQADAAGHVTRYEYDGLGRRTATVLPLGRRSTSVYDAVGNVVSTTDFNGRTTTFDHDLRDRLLARHFPDGTSTAFAYTSTGQRQTVVDARGTTTYAYDARDRLTSRTDPDGTAISYTYDPAGNRTSVTIPAGTTRYTFDELNRPATVTDPDLGVTRYAYDAIGGLLRTERPDGTVEARAYDTVGHLLSIDDRGPDGSILESFHYTLAATGRRDAVVEQDGRKVEYRYDLLDRLIGELITDPDRSTRGVDYTYDPVGNRLTRTDTAEGETVYTYDDNDRLLSETLGSRLTQYSYDDNGNTLTKSTSAVDRALYEWDAENRLVGATVTDSSGTKRLAYGYDADGIRVSSTVDGDETRYLIDAVQPYAQVLAEYTPGGVIKVSYVHGNDLISQMRGGSPSYYHVDGLGSTRALTDGSGLVTDRYVYDAFGRTIGQVGSTGNVYLFAGEQRDGATGLDYLRARYLNPANGRLVSRDAFSGLQNRPISQHRFLYANDNPVGNIDPSGHFSILNVVALSSVLLPIVYFGVKYASSGGELSFVQKAEVIPAIGQGLEALNLAIFSEEGLLATYFDPSADSQNTDVLATAYRNIVKIREDFQALLPRDIKYYSGSLPGFGGKFAYADNGYITLLPLAFIKKERKWADTSLASILVHEMAHLSVGALLQPEIYREDPVRNLAKRDPQKALQNADNYARFVQAAGKLEPG